MLSRRCARVLPLALAAGALAGCGSTPVREDAAPAAVRPTGISGVPAVAPKSRPPAGSSAAASSGPAGGVASNAQPPSPAAGAGAAATAATAATPPPAPLPEPPARAVADFQRAVALMRSGKVTDAELEFQQIAIAYPAFAAADINLGILYRKSGDLEHSEQALRAAVERESASAVAWTELGVTLRLRGHFKDAADAYNRAIAADSSYAPAYRNLGVLLDLYQGDPAGALSAFERYKELSGEEKPVSGWIAELRVRARKPAPTKDAAPPPAPATTGE